MAERYSEITVLGQTAASDTWDGAKASQQKTVVRDAGVPPLSPPHADRRTGMAGRKQQGHSGEINTRYGKGNVVSYTVYGWKDGEKTVGSERPCGHTGCGSRSGRYLACRGRNLFPG